jgi:hypothetical protein
MPLGMSMSQRQQNGNMAQKFASFAAGIIILIEIHVLKEADSHDGALR